MKTLISILAVLLLLAGCGPGGGGSKPSSTTTTGSTPTNTVPSGNSTSSGTGGDAANTAGTGSSGNATGGSAADSTGGGATDSAGGGSILASTTGSISGVVTDSDSANWGSPLPLAGVTVKAAGKTVVTGDDGTFSFSGIAAGIVAVSAARAEYTDFSTSVDVVIDETTLRDIPLVFTRALRVVTGKNGVGGNEVDFTMKLPGALSFGKPFVFENHPAWIAPLRGAWIGPKDGNVEGLAGLYTYEFHFQLSDASAATMRGAWDSDNGTVAYLNGTRIVNAPGERATPFTELNEVNANDAAMFRTGDNTLLFEVDNWVDGPTGFYFAALIKY